MSKLLRECIKRLYRKLPSKKARKRRSSKLCWRTILVGRTRKEATTLKLLNGTVTFCVNIPNTLSPRSA
ncbi:hypothetical protein I352_06464 [Cryptococcus deuterogattii MMRL2647]|nr:hypothetical protein I352_06464 [Cryptococcus deuterogattii MMRL2647]